MCMTRSFLAAAVLLAVCVLALGGCGCGVIMLAQSPPMSIMTFNIRYGTALDGENSWPKRRDFVFDSIREADPDLIGLQEALAFQVHEATAVLPQYAAIYAGRDDGKEKGETCAILYRTDRYTLGEHGTFWLSDTPDMVGSNTWNAGCTRVCTWAYLTDRQTSLPLLFYNTHLDHLSAEARLKGVDLILTHIAGQTQVVPLILTGDFNTGEGSEPILLAKEQLQDVYAEWLKNTHQPPGPMGTFNGFKNKTDGERIDYIFTAWSTPLDAEIIRTTRDGRNASDHFAVTARLHLIYVPEPIMSPASLRNPVPDPAVPLPTENTR